MTQLNQFKNKVTMLEMAHLAQAVYLDHQENRDYLKENLVNQPYLPGNLDKRAYFWINQEDFYLLKYGRAYANPYAHKDKNILGFDYKDPLFIRIYYRFPMKFYVDLDNIPAKLPYPVEYWPPDAEVFVARGTQFTHFYNLRDDRLIAFAKSRPNSTMSLAHKAYNIAVNDPCTRKHGLQVKLVGHSLGAAEVTMLAIEVAIKNRRNPPVTIAFNSPGVGFLLNLHTLPKTKEQLHNTIKKKGKELSYSYFKYIHNFNSSKGIINKIGEQVGSQQTINIKINNELTEVVYDELIKIYKEIKHGNMRSVEKIIVGLMIRTSTISRLNTMLPPAEIGIIGTIGILLAAEAYHQHKMLNMIDVIKKNPKIARETF